MTQTVVLSTLFDSGYLDKGLVIFDSLCENASDFRLYVFAFDDKCYEVLKNEYDDPRLIVVRYEDFETDEMRVARANRGPREYCWTCSCLTVRHVLTHFGESNCACINSDMYFYSDPAVLLQELIDSGCDAGVVSHRFKPCKETQDMIDMTGEFCVEYNTFLNTARGMALLNWWCDRVLEKCPPTPEDGLFGDQKYVQIMYETKEGVYATQNLGAGVAPWNIALHRADIPIVFFHFQQIQYVSETSACIGVTEYPGNPDKQLIDEIYLPYMRLLQAKRELLRDKYGVVLQQPERYIKHRSNIRRFVAYVLFSKERAHKLAKAIRILTRGHKDFIKW